MANVEGNRAGRVVLPVGIGAGLFIFGAVFALSAFVSKKLGHSLFRFPVGHVKLEGNQAAVNLVDMELKFEPFWTERELPDSCVYVICQHDHKPLPEAVKFRMNQIDPAKISYIVWIYMRPMVGYFDINNLGEFGFAADETKQIQTAEAYLRQKGLGNRIAASQKTLAEIGWKDQAPVLYAFGTEYHDADIAFRGHVYGWKELNRKLGQLKPPVQISK